MIEGQMTIWEFLQPTKEKSLEEMTEKEMVEYIGKKIGKVFIYNDYLSQWEVKLRKNYKLDLSFSNYCMNWNSDKGDGKRFISCGYGNHKGGGGRPCDSLEEAIKYFEDAIRRINNE